MSQVDVAQAAQSRVGFADPVYAEIMDFLTEEAALLDRDRFVEWVDLLAEDISYTIPRRQTRHVKDGRGLDEDSGMPANLEGLRLLAERNSRPGIYDRDPPPRFRRFVTNVKVQRTDKENEYAVDSYELMLRTKQDEPTYDFISAERRDVLRRTDDGVELVRRRVIFDQTVLSTPLPNIIL
jgi:3-phenylpropionate/cinnamic acid dioxygenase small subunit